MQLSGRSAQDSPWTLGVAGVHGPGSGCCELGECIGVRLSKAELAAHACWR